MEVSLAVTFISFYLSLAVAEPIDVQAVESWSSRLGVELWNFGKVVTRKQEMQDSFKDAKVTSREGQELVFEIAKEIKNMMELKISAVRRIMDTAENSAMALQMQESRATLLQDYQYYNAKTLDRNDSNQLELKENSHFFNIKVNTSYSAVHVPTNVYDRSPEVLQGIKWSANLDEIFISNYKQDPSLSWQYFGSSTGFMRQFPAMKWEQEPSGPVDLFDCRTRSWYIEAATSPKDILVLVDNSGSMMGQRREIARHVVNNILDTLGSNDFVNVLTFIKNATGVVPCFRERLVQANLANIRELKIGMENLAAAANIANFSVALTTAFQILETYRNERRGAACNQAIMLVTDGVPYSFEEIFRKWNWGKDPETPVRVFTYLIGREVADVREVKWMACANKGYYVHLSTMAEVREEVLHYISVMARPLVLNKTHHPIIWTPVYADITDPKMTDWLWEMKEKEKQKQISLQFRKKTQNTSEEQKRAEKAENAEREYLMYTKYNQNSNLYPYKMMTSVSMPVYDRRENANLTERVLINEAFWVLKTRETKVANLLGVVGTDVPNSEIQRLMIQHMLGVNAYAFIVTNNGYILIHPDLRPVFDGILKPSYNNIDFTDVELVHSNETIPDEREDIPSKCREDGQAILELREALINQGNGSTSLFVKYHYDSMRRVSIGKRHYYYTFINGTPFELVVALPDPYGLNRVEAILEIKRVHVKGKRVTEYFGGHNWKIHPEWFYCKYHYGDVYNFKTPEEEIIHFLNRTEKPGWKWPLQRSSPPPEHRHCHSSCNSSKDDTMDKSTYYCDRTLLLSLVYDAKATEWFSGNISLASVEEKGQDMKQRFGLVLVFMATRSGLTRWQDISLNLENETENGNQHFSNIHNRATDETWYKRAVEQYYVEPDSFVYSVPFDAGDKNDTLVTATHAVFHSEGSREAPAAVVGFQFHHSALFALFKNITSSCEEKSCEKTCDSDAYICYVLDNNGFIIVSESRADTGKFFGEVKGYIMDKLVKEEIYKKIAIYDYQAVCFSSDKGEPSHSCKMNSPINYFGWVVNWLLGKLIWILIQTNLNWISVGAFSYTTGDATYPGYDDANADIPPAKNDRPLSKIIINRTRPQPCDMKVNLYLLDVKRMKKVIEKENNENGCERPYVVKDIPNSNLIMVVVDHFCESKYENKIIRILPTEVKYDEGHCCKIGRNLSRRNVAECANRSEKENDIKLCGHSVNLSPSYLLQVFALSYFLQWIM
nr:voltage-dependent calcium channel subunit alpha-2/delta-3 isoform X2 [Halyomorpha halys]